MKKQNKKSTAWEFPVEFRERRLGDILSKKLRHPKPNPKYKATLAGPPGWQYKDDPGA